MNDEDKIARLDAKLQALAERVAYLEGRLAERDQRSRRTGPPIKQEGQ